MSQTYRHVEVVFICDFYDLCLQLSLKLYGSTICVCREVSAKVGIMEFGLNSVVFVISESWKQK